VSRLSTPCAVLFLFIAAPLRAQGGPDFWSENSAVIIVGGIIAAILAFGYLLQRRGYHGKPGPLKIPEQEKPDTFGSAEWEEPIPGMPDVRSIFDGVFFGKGSLPEFDQIKTDKHTGGPVCSVPGNHVLVTGRTRVGKGCRVVVPTLLRAYIDRSLLCVDPKGENAIITARARRDLIPQYPNAIHIINPWGELAPSFAKLGLTPFATYNPLDILDRNDPNVVGIAQDMASAICPPDQGR
jgi:hypothetical protein